MISILHKRKSKKTPVRLEKKVTLADKIQNWIDKNYRYLFIIATVVALILVTILVLAFVPGTESGLWYNGGVNNVIQ